MSVWLLVLVLAQQAPVPDPEKQKDAEKLIRDTFKEEYARKTGRDALARKLLAQAQEPQDDPATRFVLLREARELAVQAGDVATAVRAIDETGAAFAVDALSLKHAAFQSMGKTARPEQLLAASLKLVDEALEREQYDLAKQAADASGALARRMKDLASVTRADAKSREASDRRERFARIQKARDVLAAMPDDPGANAVVGLFECCFRNQWETGLARLAKCADAALKAQAEADLELPGEAAAQVKVGDGWWEIAEKQDAPTRAALQDRARHWYRLAIPQIQGLTRARLENRLAGTWIPLFDGKTLGLMKPAVRPAWEVADGLLCKKPEINEYFQTTHLFLDGEFRIRFECRGLTRMSFAVRQGDRGKEALEFVPPKLGELEGKVHEVLFQCRGPEVKAFLDGQPVPLTTRGPAVEGHLQMGGHGPTFKIHSLDYRQIR